jgi:diguanylate cyclase (GGDEF)-like protein
MTVSTDDAKMLAAQVGALLRSDRPAALQLNTKVIRLARQLSDTTLLAEALCRQGELHYHQATFEQALQCLEEAQNLYTTLGDGAGLASSLTNLGRVRERQGHYETAYQHFSDALRHAEPLANHAQLSQIQLCLGLLEYNRGSFLDAIRHYQLALQAAQTAHDPPSEGNALGNLGNCFERMGDYELALNYHLACWRIFKHDPERLMETSYALNNIANVYIALEEYDTALGYHQQSLVLKQQLNDRYGEATSFENIARCYYALKQHSEAQTYYQQALDITNQIGDKEGIAYAFGGLGAVAAAEQQWQTAFDYYHRALSLFYELDNMPQQANHYLQLGEAYSQTGAEASALECLRKAESYALKTGSKATLQQIYRSLSEHYERTQNFSEALDTLKRSYQLERELINSTMKLRLKSLEYQQKIEQVEHERTQAIEQNEALERALSELQHVNDKLHQTNLEKEQLVKILNAQKQIFERQSTEDALTGLYNRRYFDRQLSSALSSSETHLSVALCDVDNFKSVNDTFSHQIGDEVLKTVAQLLRSVTRDQDVAARYGGEEFALLLHGVSKETAASICERFRHAVEFYPWHQISPPLQITISIGICDDTSSGRVEVMTALADKCLYQAKHSGKNRVVYRR